MIDTNIQPHEYQEYLHGNRITSELATKSSRHSAVGSATHSVHVGKTPEAALITRFILSGEVSRLSEEMVKLQNQGMEIYGML